MRRHLRDIRYADPADPLRALDVDLPEGNPRGIVVWVHGGAWRHRSRRDDAERLSACFTARGYAFVTVDHRYAPNPPDPDAPGARHPDQAKDLADALAWIAGQAASIGVDASRFCLVGHSSGAHLVTLVTVHPDLLADRGVDPASVAAVASLDVRAYDIPRLLADAAPEVERMYINAFGRDPNVWRDASPQAHLRPALSPPPILVVVRGDAQSIAIKRSFIEAWRASGGAATHVDLPTWTHAQVRERLGDPSDTTLTPAVLALFDEATR